MTDAPHPAVAIRGVTKRYGDIVACDGVDLDLHRGEVHGILGENGAGKSTLMRILIGLVEPDAGEIKIDGRPRRITDPQTAAALGIGMVHQHFSLVVSDPAAASATTTRIGSEPPPSDVAAAATMTSPGRTGTMLSTSGAPNTTSISSHHDTTQSSAIDQTRAIGDAPERTGGITPRFPPWSSETPWR